MGDVDLESKYSQILIRNGILDEIEKVETVFPDMMGEQFMSICELVRVEFKGKETPDCHLFSKKMLSIPDPVQKVMFDEIMVREGTFLHKVVPAMQKFCIERTGKNGISVDDLFPKIYHADQDSIVMANLTKQGYEVLNRADMQDFQHAKLVMESLARFQAVSHAFIKAEGGPDAFIQKYPALKKETKPEIEQIFTAMMTAPFACILEMLQTSSLEGSAETYGKLEKYDGKWVPVMLEIMQAVPESVFLTLTHGDLHNNNMLFTACSDPKQKKIVFVDLQVCFIGSPGHDIGNFLFTTVKPEVRKQWRQLIRIYFDEFQAVSQKLGLCSTVTFEDFLTEFRSSCKYGFLIGMFGTVALDAMKSMATKDGLFMNRLSEVLSAWMSENKDQANRIVANLIEIVNDYEDIGTL